MRNVYGYSIEQICSNHHHNMHDMCGKRGRTMAIRRFAVINAIGETVMVMQGKQMRKMEQAVADYIRMGRLPYGMYRIELIAKEGN